MLDIKELRSHADLLISKLNRRGFNAEPVIFELLDTDKSIRDCVSKMNQFQAEINTLSKEIGYKRRMHIDTSDLELQSSFKSTEIKIINELSLNGNPETGITGLNLIFEELIRNIPNVLDDSVPDGVGEEDNIVVKEYPTSLTVDEESAKDHVELGEALGMMDFETAGKMAGSRFTILKGPLARLERAIGQFMIDYHTTNNKFTEVSVPLLVNEKTMFGTGQLPKFEEDLFKTTDGRYLIPTAEVSLTNLVADEIVDERILPLRYTALTDCFRAEAGSAGRDTRGMMRQHQFKKVELVSIVHPDQSNSEHEYMTHCAETILEALQLKYRRVLLCAGDTGFSSSKTYDLEVWLPGQKKWREISSISNCRDFQARRMNTRYNHGPNTKVKGYVHTLNGSGVAVGRMLIAIMENYQFEDTIFVPTVLQPYMGGLVKIKK